LAPKPWNIFENGENTGVNMPVKIWMRCMALMIALALAGCSAEKEPEPKVDSATVDFERLLSYMEGSFTSREQSQTDSNYYDIRLEMVRIWKDRNDGYWLYVEGYMWNRRPSINSASHTASACIISRR